MGITPKGELIVDTWESRKLVSSGEVSVRGNGDLLGAEDVIKMQEQTGCCLLYTSIPVAVHLFYCAKQRILCELLLLDDI